MKKTELVVKVLNYIKEGKTIYEAEKEFGLKAQTIRGWCKRVGVKVPKNYVKIDWNIVKSSLK